MIALRELDYRESDGVSVGLYWHPVSEVTVIALSDERTQLQTTFAVPAAKASDAFLHPYCYIPQVTA